MHRRPRRQQPRAALYASRPTWSSSFFESGEVATKSGYRHRKAKQNPTRLSCLALNSSRETLKIQFRVVPRGVSRAVRGYLAVVAEGPGRGPVPGPTVDAGDGCTGS